MTWITGAASEAEFRADYAQALDLDQAGLEAMMVDLWDAYYAGRRPWDC